MSSQEPKIFLPHLIASGDGHVINVSSVFGLFGARPGRIQRREVRGARVYRGAAPGDGTRHPGDGPPGQVTTVHPGGIKTNIVRNMTAADGVDKER